MDALDVEIRPAALEQILPLRHGILRAGLPIHTAHFPGDTAPTSIHLGAFITSGQCAGCATLHLTDFQQQRAYQLRGMAVEPTLRKHGIGAKLLAAIDMIAASSDIHLLWCNARSPAVPFYQKYGWQVVSEEFQIPTAGPHFKMIKHLQRVSQSL